MVIEKVFGADGVGVGLGAGGGVGVGVGVVCTNVAVSAVAPDTVVQPGMPMQLPLQP